jgi:DNA helicase-2/ATP-dependent DNA helicase PcrA
VLRFVDQRRLFDLDERFRLYLQDAPMNLPAGNRVAGDRDSGEEQSVLAFLAVPARELLGYRRYIEDQSPFSTQQGVKGAEFQRVLTVLDDEESDYRLFSYAKYWGIEPLSDSDQAHIVANEDSVLDRTRRLFYVCSSRALKDLAVIFFVPNVQAAHRAVIGKNLFAREDVIVMAD